MENKKKTYIAIIILGVLALGIGIFAFSENETIQKLKPNFLKGVQSWAITINEDSEAWSYTKGEQTKINYYLKDKDTKIVVPYESFLNESNKFGFVFDETNINSELSLTAYDFDKKIYYEIQSDKDYIQHSKYILSRELGTTKKVVNEIGQVEDRPLKRFIDFSEIFSKFHNLYFYNTTEELVCVEWNETNFKCLKYELQNITRTQKRDISMKMYKDKNWIIEFFNLFDLDPSVGDDTDANWNLGSMTNMEVEGSGADANLTSNMSSGGFLSRIFDAGSTVDWKNITYILEYPYGEELPANQVDEEWFNMTGNVLLMHFNNDSAYAENDTHVYDFSGEGNNGTAKSGAHPNLTNVKLGAGAFEFDGSDDYIEKTNIDLSSLTSSTISGWFSPTITYDAGESTNDDIFGMYKDTSNYLVLQLRNTGYFHIYKKIAGNIHYLDSDSSSWTGGQWYHFTYIQDSSDGMKLYIDGVLQANTNADTSSFSGLGATNWLHIGNEYYNGNNYFTFKGRIDEVAIWDRSLSVDEIKNLYNRGAARLNVSVRSCNDAGCSGESWNETDNNASFGRVEDVTDVNNQYYQYMFNYTNSSDAVVRIENVSIEYESGVPADTEYPQFSSYYDNNATLIDSGTGLFNVTITHTNGTVWLEINNTNITAQNISADVYNASTVFSTSGDYDYRWHSWGNGTEHNYNVSVERSYTVNSSDTCSCPSINTNWEINLADYCNITSNCDIGDGNITFINAGTFFCNATITANKFTPKDSSGVAEKYNLGASCRIILSVLILLIFNYLVIPPKKIMQKRCTIKC